MHGVYADLDHVRTMCTNMHRTADHSFQTPYAPVPQNTNHVEGATRSSPTKQQLCTVYMSMYTYTRTVSLWQHAYARLSASCHARCHKLRVSTAQG